MGGHPSGWSLNYKKRILAVSVDRVYQTVLALANKEQRGYITPQEFNLFANHAQNEIFEQYFYDLNQFLRVPIGNNTVTSDLRDLVEEKIASHMTSQLVDAFGTNEDGEIVSNNAVISSTNIHKIESVLVSYDQGAHWVEAKEMESASEIHLYQKSKMTMASKKRPVFTRSLLGGGIGVNSVAIQVYPTLEDNAKIDVRYIVKPLPPNWTYVLIGSDAIYNPAAADMRDFNLHQSEEKNLVMKILLLAGVSIQDPNITQIAGAKEQLSVQQEKS